MSYCRFGEDSDVYVYHHINGGWECCACILDEGKTRYRARKLILAHLMRHRGFGHKVPEDAIKRLKKEMKNGR